MRVGKRLGKYELEAPLGGHGCQVFEARDVRVGRRVAIKILPADADTERRERMLAEARVSSRLRHANLIEVFDFGEEDGQLYLVMELLEGSTLGDALRAGTLGDRGRVLEIAREIASALGYIHSHHIIHRDVKPDNIYLDREGHVKLLDFGLAKIQGLDLTGEGFTLGTPYYMAPEQVRGERLTPLIDVYAFGVTLYEMLTAVRPIQGRTVDEVFEAILRAPLDIEPLWRAGVPPALAYLVKRCTAQQPEERPGGFGEILPLLAG